MPADRSDLTSLVRQLIEATGKTQRQLGALLGVDESAISNWLSGRRFPRAEHLAALIDLAEAYIAMVGSGSLSARLAVMERHLSDDERGVIATMIGMAESRVRQQEAG